VTKPESCAVTEPEIPQNVQKSTLAPIENDLRLEIKMTLAEKNLLIVTKFIDKIKEAFPQAECSFVYEKCVLKGNGEGVRQVADGINKFLSS